MKDKNNYNIEVLKIWNQKKSISPWETKIIITYKSWKYETKINSLYNQYNLSLSLSLSIFIVRVVFIAHKLLHIGLRTQFLNWNHNWKSRLQVIAVRWILGILRQFEGF